MIYVFVCMITSIHDNIALILSYFLNRVLVIYVQELLFVSMYKYAYRVLDIMSTNTFDKHVCS